jgi:site-specific DNA recombinase
MVSVAAYARVSTDRQAESQTIEQQVERLQAYAQQQGWSLPAERIYQDNGESGARLDRPALDRLRDVVAGGAIDVVLITSPDRLARRYAYQVWLLEEIERAGCAVVFLERPPTGDPQDALVIQIRGAVAEYERAVIADRMRRGRLAALRAGRLLPWTTPPFGYRLDPLRPRDPAGVQLDEAAAAVVRQIFAWYVEEGLTLYGIAQRLIAEQVPTPSGRAYWNASSVRKILTNSSYQGVAYGNQKQMVPAKRRHPLIGREPKGAGGESCRLRPPEDWIGVPVPAIISAERFAQAQERLARNRQWATRNTRGQYLLRCLLSCRRCGLAHHVWTNGTYAYYRCRGMDVLANRGRREPCHARQLPTARLDRVVWEDLCRVLQDPAVLDEAWRRAQRGWLSGDERSVRRQDLRRRRAQVQRQIQRLVDAYEVEALTLEELQTRRARLEKRLADLDREVQHLEAASVQAEHLEVLATRIEEFRDAMAQRLEEAPFELRRALVELLIDRVVVDAPDVEIRYVIPLSGAARRNGVLRPRHRTTQQGDQAPHRRGRHLPERGRRRAAGRSGARRAARRVASGSALLQRGVARQADRAGGGVAGGTTGRELRPRVREDHPRLIYTLDGTHTRAG